MPVNKVAGTISSAEPIRIDHFVKTLVELSRSKLNGLFQHGCVTLNGQPCLKSETRVSKGDRVEISYDPQQGYAATKRAWSDRTFSIIYEDDLILVINKSAGTLTVPTNKSESNTLHERVSFYLGRKKKNHESLLVHRLDRSMSGIMVFAKTPDAATKLRAQFDDDTAQRRFIAIVHGVVEQDEGVIESWLETHNNLNRFSTEEKKGQHALTKFKVLKRMPDATSLEIQLVTARRHQARVHLYEMGHRIVGESRYVDDHDEPHERWKSKRMAFHATSLSFVHPGTEKQVTYVSDLPLPMKKFLRFRPLGLEK